MRGPGGGIARELYDWQQRKILQMKANGHTAQEIADRLGLAKHTVWHRWNKEVKDHEKNLL